MLAYVLIGLEQADEKEIMQKLSKLSEVKETHILFGEWDLIIKIEAETTDALGNFVMDHIRQFKGIKLSTTLICAK
ncbi:Lrp/AsnC family transcriptional regulator [Candidatus Woesearchaeota archaeon]|nr:MAG: Lrp/AsnC family transcriptional regulator [Candidatus Woesearchaeota archaeon]